MRKEKSPHLEIVWRIFLCCWQKGKFIIILKENVFLYCRKWGKFSVSLNPKRSKRTKRFHFVVIRAGNIVYKGYINKWSLDWSSSILRTKNITGLTLFIHFVQKGNSYILIISWNITVALMDMMDLENVKIILYYILQFPYDCALNLEDYLFVTKQDNRPCYKVEVENKCASNSPWLWFCSNALPFPKSKSKSNSNIF